MGKPLIEFKGVTKRFNSHTVLDQVDLEIYEGEVATIIGKSGGGKSVLLKHIVGLLQPDEGMILFGGQPIYKMGKKEWNRYISQVSYMFQNNALFDSMTVFDNIAFPLRQTTHLGRRAIEEKVRTRLEQMELGDVGGKYPSELSGGMQKRVALSRALVTDPRIVLFDEPTTGQDMIRRNAILSMIAQYQRRFGFTAVLISHDVPDVFFISSRILALDEGKIVFQGTPEAFETFQHPFQDEFVDSLEELQEHLTGIYSKRHFKVRYQKLLGRKRPQERFVVGLFALDHFEDLCEHLGHTAGQEILDSLGKYINKHFGAVGGFSARQSRSQFSIVLPFSNLPEAEQILRDFSMELREEGLRTIQTEARIHREACFEFAVLAGLAEGEFGVKEIDRILGQARKNQREVARVHCGKRR
ncbi:MAG: ATP-binding cassette domain-containing protein [Deltaproteobacteria bacterium]|nr:ATP-binding cassette domain-containing protein [Deltaproteobacteria bacterium]